jgi:TetR/AcrR family transcriptional regulator
MSIQERKEREKEHRKEEIIDAAQRIFFEKGLNAATMDEIAESAELSKGTLYIYYSSKEDLYLAVLMRGLKLLHSMFSEVITHETSVVAILDKMEKAYIRFFNTQRNYFRMLNFFQAPHFHKQVSEEMKKACTIENDSNWEQIVELLRRGVREKKIRADINPVEIAVILWSSVTSLMLRIDSEGGLWQELRDIDLTKTLEISDRLIINAILTPEGRKEYAALFQKELSMN